jgi:hypothetical protein
MTDLGSSRRHVAPDHGAYDRAPAPTGWTGWVVFASIMMILLGLFQSVQGLVGIFDPGYYHVTASGLIVSVDYTAWGWAHLLLGVLIVICGLGVLAGNLAARIVAVVLAGLSALMNLVFIEAYPIWSIIAITLDVLVIYAVTVHGRELRSSDM